MFMHADMDLLQVDRNAGMVFLISKGKCVAHIVLKGVYNAGDFSCHHREYASYRWIHSFFLLS